MASLDNFMVRLPQGSAAVVNAVTPADCPHVGDTPHMAKYMQIASMEADYCLVIQQLDRHTERMMEAMNDEIGPGSKSSRKHLVTKYPGSGTGKHTISDIDCIRLYRIHVATHRATTTYDHPHEKEGQMLKLGGMFFTKWAREIVLLELRSHLTIHPRILATQVQIASEPALNRNLLGLVSDYLEPPVLEMPAAPPAAPAAGAVVPHVDLRKTRMMAIASIISGTIVTWFLTRSGS